METNALFAKQTFLNFFQIFLNFFHFLLFFHSFQTVLDWKLIKLLTRTRGKHVFVQLTIMCCSFFFEDTSYDGIIIDKCFIFNLFYISVNQTQNSPLPSKVLFVTILEMRVRIFILIPKLYHFSFLSCNAQYTCKSYIFSLV